MIQPLDTISILDIDGHALPDNFKWRIDDHKEYKDNILTEHLFSAAGILEANDQDEAGSYFTPEEKDLLVEIAAVMRDNDASYFRIVYN